MMLKYFPYSFALKHLDKIQITTDQKFGCAITKLSKQIHKQFSSEECVATTKKFREMKYIPFLNKIELRKKEARRSIIVQVQSEKSYKPLYTYCSSIGTVNKMFHYTTGIEPTHFIIVEFAEELDLRNVFNVSAYNEENVGVPTQSHFFWFRAVNRKLAKLKQNEKAKLDVENSTKLINNIELMKLLFKCNDVSDQILTLYNSTKLNDVGTRLRFLTGNQIETCLIGIFPNASVYPFGSSVNEFGKMDCDLDLVLRLNSKENSNESRLVFHCKASSGSERNMNQKYMESLGDIIHLFLPGCGQVRRILQARIPIIKFYQQFTNIECDLSMSNMSGVYMSDFLYMMGELDERVRPLVFVVRNWAKAVGITNSSPGRWITNFSLSLLVLAFLQNPLRSPPILPSLNMLVKFAGPNDKYITEDGINCTFLRDLNKLNHQTKNTESLEELLKEFFEYYSQFNFSERAVCLNEAVSVTKPEFNPMYIINPLEKGLNVSKNVTSDEIDRFKKETQNAVWTLESQRDSELWGIIGLLESHKNVGSSFSSYAKQGRLMDVTALFEQEQETNVQYKNLEVKKQVNNIKQHTREQVNNLENYMKTKR